MRRPTLLPEPVLVEAVTALYSEADSAGWDSLSPGDRSRKYAEWVEPGAVIAKILNPYMTPEAARSWIKDGPMKEYARANRGVGRYARFGRTGGTTVADIVRAALGNKATVEGGSEQVKPLRCHAVLGETRYLVTWGQGKNFKDLVWAALKAAIEHDLAAHVVVMEPPGKVTPIDERDRQRAIADRCAVGLHHMREVLGTRPGPAVR